MHRHKLVWLIPINTQRPDLLKPTVTPVVACCLALLAYLGGALGAQKQDPENQHGGLQQTTEGIEIYVVVVGAV